MRTSILTLTLERKRDVAAASQRARQIAGMLGFERRLQLRIAADVFVLAARTHRRYPGGAICFELQDDHFRIFSADGTGGDRLLGILQLRPTRGIDVPLPAGDEAKARTDLAWMAEHLQQMTPLNLFEEMEQLQQELGTALAELERTTSNNRLKPHAA